MEDFPSKKIIDTLTRDICSVGFRMKSDIRRKLQNLRLMVLAEVMNGMPPIAKHNEWCECLSDKNMPCDCGVSEWNQGLLEWKKNIDKMIDK